MVADVDGCVAACSPAAVRSILLSVACPGSHVQTVHQGAYIGEVKSWVRLCESGAPVFVEQTVASTIAMIQIHVHTRLK